MSLSAKLAPRTMAGQMSAVLAFSLALLLGVLALLEVLEQAGVVEWAESDATIARLERMRAALEFMSAEETAGFIDATSRCHEGYALTDGPFEGRPAIELPATAERIARGLALEPDRVRAQRIVLERADFSYEQCDPEAIEVPAEGVVISVRLDSGRWLQAEIHPHEWHLRGYLIGWIARALGAFLVVGTIALFFVRRLTRPLDQLTGAAARFGSGLKISAVEEAGPPDLRRAIRSFNAMQQQVAEEVARRTQTLAAISHDVRTPLTALRIKAELVDDDEARSGLITSIETMERMTVSALEYLRGERRNEPMRLIDLSALVESECTNFQESGHNVSFAGDKSLLYTCRPEALSSALRNLIDNALKYGTRAEVSLYLDRSFVEIVVADDGPGIAEDQRALSLEPFERLSSARDGRGGGFGLGLAIVRAIVEGHGGEIVLASNQPQGLVAKLRLPAPSAAAKPRH